MQIRWLRRELRSENRLEPVRLARFFARLHTQGPCPPLQLVDPHPFQRPGPIDGRVQARPVPALGPNQTEGLGLSAQITKRLFLG
jgi:hypothetical protein